MKIEKNVSDFLEKCAHEVGNYRADLFSVNTWNEYEDLEINSPIERILYTAMKALCALNLIADADPCEIRGEMVVLGISIDPQFKIGKYRVDFRVSYGAFTSNAERIKASKSKQGSENAVVSSVIVECDSQQFHERTERERRYEKERDRHLQSSGNVVFRYTGADIIKRPMEIAAEIISFVTGISVEDLQLDSNIAD